MIKRFFYLFSTNIKALLQDPIPILGGLIAPLVMLFAFGILFSGNLSFKAAVINQDEGVYGELLRESFNEVISPLNDQPYYDLQALPEEKIWQEYEKFHLDTVWVIPPDFSERVRAGEDPEIKMYFNNYNDDRAKNHRIYPAEIVWHFYEKAGFSAPPLDVAEKYPLDSMVQWFPIMGVGIVLTSVMLGAMFNAFVLTFREQENQITLEFGLMPRSLLWVYIPKTILALIMGLLTGTLVLFIFYLWTGAWPQGGFIWAFWLLSGLVSLFWVALSTLLGLGVKDYFAGAILSILGAILIFFISGGMSLVRLNWDDTLLVSRFFPNLYAVDPLRDLVLFNIWPLDFTKVLFILLGFAGFGLAAGWTVASWRLRRHG